MKKCYLLSVLGLFMTLTTTLAQPLREGATPTEPPALRTRKALAPFLGITVNIPLWKVLGKKKAKTLPEMPQTNAAPFYVEERSPVVPELMELGGDTVEVVVNPVVKDTAQIDLDEVTVTAPRTPIILPDPPRGGDADDPTTPPNSTPGHGGGGPTAPPTPPVEPEPNKYLPTLEDLNCGGYQNFYQKSVVSGKEQGGLITADGKIISLPTKDGSDF